MSGFIVGVIRMVLDFVYMFDAPKCWETVDTRPAIVANVRPGVNGDILILLSSGVLRTEVSIIP